MYITKKWQVATTIVMNKYVLRKHLHAMCSTTSFAMTIMSKLFKKTYHQKTYLCHLLSKVSFDLTF